MPRMMNSTAPVPRVFVEDEHCAAQNFGASSIAPIWPCTQGHPAKESEALSAERTAQLTLFLAMRISGCDEATSMALVPTKSCFPK